MRFVPLGTQTGGCRERARSKPAQRPGLSIYGRRVDQNHSGNELRGCISRLDWPGALSGILRGGRAQASLPLELRDVQFLFQFGPFEEVWHVEKRFNFGCDCGG